MRRSVTLLLALLVGAGCVQDMANQPRKEPLEASRFFADGSSARQPVPGTVARGELEHDEVFHTGKRGDEHATSLPFPLTLEVLRRGHERYDVFCSPCHDRVGRGAGMVVRRGFRQPASFHSERLRGEPVGYYVDVMTSGFGTMPSYAGQVPPRDRWAIAAYIRALQLSQQAGLDDVPAAYREALERGRTVRIEGEPAGEDHR